MKKIKILILEDDAYDAELLKATLLDNYEVIIAETFNEATEKYKVNAPDLLILDIYINKEHEGIRFAESLTKENNDVPPIIFLTSANDLATFRLAKKINPDSYLLKPFNELELQFSIELAFEKHAREVGKLTTQSNSILKMQDTFLIKKNGMLYKVGTHEISHIEADGRYCNIHTDTMSFLIQQSLKDLAGKMPENFIITHRRCVVNTEKILNVNASEYYLTMHNGKTLPVSQRHRKNLLDSFMIIK